MVWVMSGLTSISPPCINLMAVANSSWKRNEPLADATIADAIALGVDMLELSHDVVMVRTLLSEKVAVLNDMPSVALGGKV